MIPPTDRVAPPDAFIAVDWGTTNRRAFLIDGGRVIRSVRDDRGAAAVSDFPAEAAALRASLGDLPMLMAGMVGSNIGWRAVRYVAAPADIAAVAAGLERIDDRTAIVPGLSWTGEGRADIMRGEEVQLLGAVAAGMVPPDALLCQPGTHCKWAVVADAAITRFVTAMTGELFALLRTHGLLARQLGGEVVDGAAFREGVAEGARRDLAASLFGVRAHGVLELRRPEDAASFASGVLIGADVAARIAQDTPHVFILADPGLGGLYAAAVAVLGGTATVVDSTAAFVAGITRIRELSS